MKSASIFFRVYKINNYTDIQIYLYICIHVYNYTKKHVYINAIIHVYNHHMNNHSYVTKILKM